MKKSTYVIIACVAIFLAGCLYYFLKDEPLVSKEPAEIATSEPSTMSYVGNSIVEEKDGKRLWELSAETIEVDTNTKNMKLKNMKGIFYQTNGGKIDITAPEAVMDSKTKDIVMAGKVQAVATDNTSFTAQEIRWSSQEQRFYGTGDILLTKDDTVMTGDRIEGDKNLGKIKLSGHANIVKGGVQK